LLRSDTEVARESEFQTSAHGGTVDFRDRHQRQLFDPPEQKLESPHLLGKAEVTVSVTETPLHLGKVGAGAEYLLIAADMQNRQIVAVFERVDQFVEPRDPGV